MLEFSGLNLFLPEIVQERRGILATCLNQHGRAALVGATAAPLCEASDAKEARPSGEGDLSAFAAIRLAQESGQAGADARKVSKRANQRSTASREMGTKNL